MDNPEETSGRGGLGLTEHPSQKLPGTTGRDRYSSLTNASDHLSLVPMALSKEERVMAFAVKDPRFPMSVVEGTFKGERAVFLCLMDAADQKDQSKGFNMTPFARLLDMENDLPHIKGAEGNELGEKADPAGQIILPAGMTRETE